MSVKAEDLEGFIGKFVTLQIDTALEGGDEDYREVTGKVIAASRQGVVLQARSGSEIYDADVILDVEEVVRSQHRPLIKRWIRVAVHDGCKQHLLDRHGMPIDLVKAMTHDAAVEMHAKIDHDRLGHSHGEKPKGKRGRPRKEGGLIPHPRRPDHDELEDEESDE